MPVLARPVTDAEATLGGGLIAHLNALGGDGLTDQTGEIAIACMLAMYAEHRRELKDLRALDRITDNARQLVEQGRFRLLTGDAYAKHVADDVGAGRRTL